MVALIIDAIPCHVTRCALAAETARNGGVGQWGMPRVRPIGMRIAETVHRFTLVYWNATSQRAGEGERNYGTVILVSGSSAEKLCDGCPLEHG